MNTVGQIIKDARIKKGISLSRLESLTRIKKDFIQKIENSDWDNLPDFPVVSGFVKNLSGSLGISVNNTMAVLRRDYLPKKLAINPKPDVESRFSWSPKLAFVIGVGSLIFLVLGYLGFEYSKFIKAPQIYISSPQENETISKTVVKIKGKTTTDATLTVNNQPVILDQDGNFESEINVDKKTQELVFVVVSRSGMSTEIRRKIEIEN